jgi:hypothetical protein
MLGSGYNTNAIGMAGRLRKTILFFLIFMFYVDSILLLKPQKKLI